MSANTIDAVRQVFLAVLELPADTDLAALSRHDLEAWDSLAHVLLCTAIESEFDIEIDLEDAADIASFADMVAYLQGRIPGLGPQ